MGALEGYLDESAGAITKVIGARQLTSESGSVPFGR